MQNREDIFNLLRNALVELFELDPASISLESHLYQDLEIDSIDAIDLIDHIKRHYYMTHDEINPTRIVPLGPELDFAAPHGRERLGG